jgi:hypothetical protein
MRAGLRACEWHVVCGQLVGIFLLEQSLVCVRVGASDQML